MQDEPDHSCGVIGMALSHDVSYLIKNALRVIQHRGQESAGIAVFNDGIEILKGMGLVHEVLEGEQLRGLKGTVGIGHVRYSTSGASVSDNCQPIVVGTSAGELALGHNGDITNADELRSKLKTEGWAFLTDSDSEIVIRILANELTSTLDPFRAIKETMSKLEGSYSLVLLIGDRIFGVRDPHGFRPLCLGRVDHGYALASESAVFDVLQGEFIRDIQPGEIVEITPEGFKSKRGMQVPNQAHCMFEFVYFARPDSIIDGREVFETRNRIGKILAREHPVDADVVIPVPDSGRAHAVGFAEGSGLEYEEGLMKNRYVERTFIMPDQSDREESVALKLNPIKSTIEGRRVVLVDDSIVRGTTLTKIVQIVKEAGAKEVHVRIGSPPIRAPCFYGIDMKTRDQFAASSRTVPEIAEFITADSLGYISIDGLVEAIGISKKDLCLACLTGEYPTDIPGERRRFQKRLELDY